MVVVLSQWQYQIVAAVLIAGGELWLVWSVESGWSAWWFIEGRSESEEGQLFDEKFEGMWRAMQRE